MTTDFDDEEDRRCAAELRQFYAVQTERNMADLRDRLAAEGVPPAVVEAAVCYAEGLQGAQLERDLPLMLAAMKLTSGDVSVH